MSSPLYLDYNSTTPVDAQVLGAMLPYFSEKFGNASSAHSYGWTAAEAVKLAAEKVAKFINCLEQEIVFTSGSTEACNLALKGVFETYAGKGKHIVTLKTDHKAILEVCASLEKKGAIISYLDVDANGRIDLEELRKTVSNETILVALSYANNETGVIQPIKEIAEIVHAAGSILFCDATQVMGKIPVDVQADGIDLMCFSGHKMYGPKGVGALYIRRKNPRVTLRPQIEGGGQQRGLRSGTLNVPLIVGLGKACEMGRDMVKQFEPVETLRKYLEEELMKIEGAKLNGHSLHRLPNTINISFKGCRADALIMGARELIFSAGSACTSAVPEPSHVLTAMGVSRADALSSVRLSLGKDTTQADADFALNKLSKALTELRSA
jgi:cysteine desulfurase